MKFTILSHAGMLVEDKGKSILLDPWLIGSCYWRSWWNFPEIEREFLNDIKPDYIYLTHLHWDHFQAPSLRLFDKDVKYLVPKIPGTRMVRDLKSIKRTNIVEIPHGKSIELWENCFLHSYQFGFFAADSACVISDGKTTLFNANDCKTFGYPLNEIAKKFPQIDFVFRSHSSATPLPYCIKDYQQNFADFRTKQDYIEEFTNFSLAVGAKYGIPFASNHCFLHKETKKFNDTGVNPQMVADYYNSNLEAKSLNSECVVMVPGSSWSPEEGFKLREFDYANKDQIIEEMSVKYADKLNKYYEKEEKTKADFKAFERYFSQFLNATPFLLRKKMLPKVLFKTSDFNGEKFFLLDIPNKQIVDLQQDTDDVDYKITVPAIVLMGCVRQKMFSVWSASKRLEIEVVRGGLGKLQALLGFLDFFENEGLPLRLNFNRRNFPIWLSRWREGFEALRL
ncbi:MAG: MBL fold metallo-hydrolase, partial [Pyrinomonadaceae bacterium]|nr:MBL fold metallo-hydrolase [Pyrinomonadaceae bacterium]